MKLTEVERLILANQYDILARLEEDEREKKDLDNLREIYSRGYSIFYDYHSQIDDELSIEDSRFVLNVLDMYDWFYYSYGDFTQEEKDFLPYEDLKFDGFDLNDSEEVKLLVFAEFLINDQEKFKNFIERSTTDKKLNSHGFGPGIEGYHTMLSVFNQVKESGERLNFEQVKEILNSRYSKPKY